MFIKCDDQTTDKLVIFIINALTNYYNVATCDVYKILSKTGAISNYIVKHYDVLHTYGKEYLINDLNEYLTRRGEKIC